jgi:hypothetical protein
MNEGQRGELHGFGTHQGRGCARAVHGAAAEMTSGEKLLVLRWPYDHCDAAQVLLAERRSLGSKF